MNNYNLCETPNKFTDKPIIKIEDNIIYVKGYNSYVIKNSSIIPNKHNNKFKHIYKYLTNIENKTILDLGSANGLFTILSALNSAKLVTSVDIDDIHLNIIRKIKHELKLDNLNIVKDNVENITQKHDIVLVLALIHWIYSCTSVKFGSLDKIMKWLSNITNEYIIIEWVDAVNDKSVNWFKHTEYNKEYIIEDYTKENFDKALNKYFKNIKHIGDTNMYRKLYIAYK